jgi:potassium efflux system protein
MPLHRFFHAFVGVCLLGIGGYPHASLASTTTSLNGAQEVTQEQIDNGRKAAESDTTLEESQKQKALDLFDQASKGLQQAKEAKAQLLQLKTQIEQAPQKIAAIRTDQTPALASPLPDLQPVLTGGNLDQLEFAVSSEQLALQQARDAYQRQLDELARLLVGSKGFSEEIAARQKTLEQITSDLQTSSADEQNALSQARALMLKNRQALRQTELETLQLRLGNHDLLTNLAQAERDLLQSEIATRQERLNILSSAAQAQRETRARLARQQAEALKSRTEDLPQSLQRIAQENAQYHHELEQLVTREQALANELQSARLKLDAIKNEFERTRQRVQVVGATEAIGKMLKRRRAELPSLQNYRRASATRNAEIGRATDQQIEVEELLREYGDTQAVTAKALASLAEPERARFEQQIIELAKARRDALNELQKIYGRYIGHITSLELAEQQLLEVANAYIDYIDDQLIWIPGRSFMVLMQPDTLLPALGWLLSPSHWQALSQDFSTLPQQHPFASALLLGAVLLLWRQRQRAADELRKIARETRKIRTDSFRLTLLALFYTLLLISAWPLLLIGTGWLLGSLPNASPFTLAMAKGWFKAGLILFSLSFLIQVCRADGVADRHLRWPAPLRAAMTQEFSWLLPLALSFGLLIATATSSDPLQASQPLGRLAFIVLMLISTVFIFRLLWRKGAFMQSIDSANNAHLMGQLHFLWFPLLLSIPALLAITAAAGYYYAALHLEQRVEQTFWFFVGLFLLKELLLRSLYIAERRLRLEDALQRRDELRAQRALSATETEEDALPISLEIPELNFTELNEQNKRLVHAAFLFCTVLGIWSIWNDLLPALGFLNSTELPFHASRIIDGIAKEVPVTLGDLIIGLVIILVTVLAAKNIPGVLEITLLQRLPLDPGARYAITSLSQYAIAGIGVLAAFSTLGLQWSSVQWLVAALSVGLGFGLQEIVANFISGIILLFERPIRVGDVVTIDNTTGKVSRIRIRATTITNWDKQELLIPNKEFITGRVINWTLSDKINRIVISVGVAYGSDVAKALCLLLEAASENPQVLDEPKSSASFEAFGDNALTLLLRCYLGSTDDRVPTTTALHQAINDKFAAAAISIAFPQRDLHLDTSKPLDIRLHPS